MALLCKTHLLPHGCLLLLVLEDLAMVVVVMCQLLWEQLAVDLLLVMLHVFRACVLLVTIGNGWLRLTRSRIVALQLLFTCFAFGFLISVVFVDAMAQCFWCTVGITSSIFCSICFAVFWSLVDEAQRPERKLCPDLSEEQRNRLRLLTRDAFTLPSEGRLGSSSCCAICLEDFENEEELLELTCGHVHHADCMRRWFVRGGRACPLRCEALAKELPDPNPDANVELRAD